MKKVSKTEAKKQIQEFFKDIKSKTPKEIKKIKRFAMSYNLPLRELRKKFCKKCSSPRLKTLGIRKGIKRIECQNCKKISRWKIK